jgi:hypothetical protein
MYHCVGYVKFLLCLCVFYTLLKRFEVRLLTPCPHPYVQVALATLIILGCLAVILCTTRFNIKNVYILSTLLSTVHEYISE